MATLDRYIVREAIAPFLIALGLFTFVLGVNPILEKAEVLLAKGVPVPTVAYLLATLLPQALSLAIPMAFLTGILMALGRLSGDRESVALLACGVSPVRVLRPVLVLAALVGGLDMYVLMKLKPDANQSYREVTYQLLAEYSDTDIKPRVFFERFPGLVLYVRDTAPGGVWAGVLLADTSDPGRPVVTLAASGRLVADPAQRLVRIVLTEAHQYTPGRADPRVYTASRHEELSLQVSADAVFGTGDILLSRGLAELDYAGLLRRIDELRAEAVSPHNEVMHLQQMFSFPVACLVFAIVGVAVGLSTRRDGRFAALTLGLVVILLYYALMGLTEAWTKGEALRAAPAFPAVWARWIPNLVLALLGLIGLVWQTRASGRAMALPLPRRLAAAPSPDSPSSSPAYGRAASAAPARVVLRVPDVSLPGPRLLDRYVTRRYLRVVALAAVGLLLLYYVGTFIDLAEKLFKGQADTRTFFAFLWHSTPQFIAWLLPIAALVGALATIGGLARTSELVVMKASGVSLYRAALPLVLIALVWGGLAFLLEERVLGESNRIATRLNDTIRGRTPHTIDVANHNWLVGDDDRIYHYAVFEPPGRPNSQRATVHQLSVFETVNEPLRLTSHTFARRAAQEGDRWRIDSGWRQHFAGDTMTREELIDELLSLVPVQDFRRAQVDATRMSFGELRTYVQRLGASGYNVAEQRVDLHHKIAFPAAALVMTLLAVPFGAITGRRGALYLVGLAIVLASAYFLLTTFFVAVGSAGLLPPFLAAWGANILFSAAALYLVLSVRT